MFDIKCEQPPEKGIWGWPLSWKKRYYWISSLGKWSCTVSYFDIKCVF